MNAYRQALLRRQEQLNVLLGRQAPPEFQGGEDEPVARTSMLDVMSSKARLAAELQEVETALNRLDAGEYGICTDCQGSIPRARLSVHPATPRCVRCQERVEQHGPIVRIAGEDDDEWVPKLPPPAKPEDEEDC